MKGARKIEASGHVCRLAAAPMRLRRAVCAPVLAGIVQLWSVALPAAEAEKWQVAGQQGLVRFVIVPQEQVADEKAYQRQIAGLCDPRRTCFLNFYTNSTGTAPAVPLPDAISQEATATFRRSMKNGVQIFTWSCRLKIPARECF